MSDEGPEGWDLKRLAWGYGCAQKDSKDERVAKDRLLRGVSNEAATMRARIVSEMRAAIPRAADGDRVVAQMLSMFCDNVEIGRVPGEQARPREPERIADLEEALRQILEVSRDRERFVMQGPRGWLKAEQIAERALKGARE